jgi:hypothetical protein
LTLMLFGSVASTPKTGATSRSAPARTGVAEVYGGVAAVAAAAFDRRLSALAMQVGREDPRTLDQRRADAWAR